MFNRFWGVSFFFLFGLVSQMQACIWDSKTLWQEKFEHPDLASAILNPQTVAPDVQELTDRIQNLNAKPNTNDSAWWNDLAGAYLRLGKPAAALQILEPLTNQFAGDYGIHANLGTAYHLLGRYAEAEKEIARDLQINPDAHFGLEKYHLALLEYLSRDENYRLRHVYVEEFTRGFLECDPFVWPDKKRSTEKWKDEEVVEIQETFKQFLQKPPEKIGKHFDDFLELILLMEQDQPPDYFAKWDLAADPQLDEGVIYMATLNPKEPACWVMLGIIATNHRDFNLAKAAYKRAIALNSPQSNLLVANINGLNQFHPSFFRRPDVWHSLLLIDALSIIFYLLVKWRKRKKLR